MYNIIEYKKIRDEVLFLKRLMFREDVSMVTKSIDYKEVPIEKLRWKCDLSSFKIKTTDDLEPCKQILGQKTALKAVQLGLNMEYLGYNLFITGNAGTGRSTTIKMLLEGKKREGKCLGVLSILPKNSQKTSGSLSQPFLLIELVVR